jgi:hypothetical protein
MQAKSDQVPQSRFTLTAIFGRPQLWTKSRALKDRAHKAVVLDAKALPLGVGSQGEPPKRAITPFAHALFRARPWMTAAGGLDALAGRRTVARTARHPTYPTFIFRSDVKIASIFGLTSDLSDLSDLIHIRM